MRTAAAGMALWVVATVPAAAGGFDLAEWCRRAEAAAQSLFAAGRPDPEIIAAPAGIDRQMARVPPSPHGALRIIVPPAGR